MPQDLFLTVVIEQNCRKASHPLIFNVAKFYSIYNAAEPSKALMHSIYGVELAKLIHYIYIYGAELAKLMRSLYGAELAKLIHYIWS